jgi:hypothetical protein
MINKNCYKLNYVRKHSLFLLTFTERIFFIFFDMSSPRTPRVVLDDEFTSPKKSVQTIIRALNTMIRLAELQESCNDIKEELLREWDPSAGI